MASRHGIRWISLVAFALTVLPAAAQNPDRIHVFDPAKKKEETISARIKQETPKEIIIERGTRTEPVSVVKVIDVEYGIPASLRVDVQAKAAREEETAAKEPDAARRLKGNELAIAGYRDLIEQLAKLGQYGLAKRHTEFKIAAIRARMAEDDPTQLDDAVKALTQFKTENEKSWQIGRVGKLLARLQIAKGDMKGAQATFDEFARRDDLPDALRQEFELAGIRALLSADNFPDAERKLATLAQSLAKDDPQAARVEIYLAACKAKSNLADAEKRLTTIIRGDAEPAVKALAYNTLGDCYRLNNRPDDAFWQYLWVDQQYPQDREEHAKALYHLSILFDKAKNRPDRAKACLDRLLTDKLFAGLEYQKLAAKDSKRKAAQK
jgi:hypothetical protein